MENTIISLKRKLDTLTVFRGLLEDPAFESFMDLAFEIEDYLEDKAMEDDEDCFTDADPSEAISAYCRFVSDIYGQSGSDPEDVPAGAAINEAVELDKFYDEPETTAFVNGVLGSFVRGDLGEEAAPEED